MRTRWYFDLNRHPRQDPDIRIADERRLGEADTGEKKGLSGPDIIDRCRRNIRNDTGQHGQPANLVRTQIDFHCHARPHFIRILRAYADIHLQLPMPGGRRQYDDTGRNDGAFQRRDRSPSKAANEKKRDDRCTGPHHAVGMQEGQLAIGG
jgi:hypothetical protein